LVSYAKAKSLSVSCFAPIAVLCAGASQCCKQIATDNGEGDQTGDGEFEAVAFHGGPLFGGLLSI
jgi:hypothetical protein